MNFFIFLFFFSFRVFFLLYFFSSYAYFLIYFTLTINKHTNKKYFESKQNNIIKKSLKTNKMTHQNTANVELELSPSSVQFSQNLIDTSVVSTSSSTNATASNDLHGLSINSESNQPQQQQHATSGKKDLFNWFTSSTSTSTSSAMNNNSSIVSASSSSATAASPQSIVSQHNRHYQQQHHQKHQQQQMTFNNVNEDDNLNDVSNVGSSSSPSMKINSKLSYGEKFISKFNKNGNKATTHTSPTIATKTTAEHQSEAPKVQDQPQQQQKTSRRTTSLLNLFMSNAQGNILHFSTKSNQSINQKIHIHKSHSLISLISSLSLTHSLMNVIS
jgi:hypothetical protein